MSGSSAAFTAEGVKTIALDDANGRLSNLLLRVTSGTRPTIASPLGTADVRCGIEASRYPTWLQHARSRGEEVCDLGGEGLGVLEQESVTCVAVEHEDGGI